MGCRPWQKLALAVLVASSTLASVRQILDDFKRNGSDVRLETIPGSISTACACLLALDAARTSLQMLLQTYKLTIQTTTTYLQAFPSASAGKFDNFLLGPGTMLPIPSKSCNHSSCSAQSHLTIDMFDFSGGPWRPHLQNACTFVFCYWSCVPLTAAGARHM